jgi:hypothetical protein
VTRLQKTLPCKLSDVEFKGMSTRFSSLMTQYLRVEDEKKAAAKTFKERLDELWGDMIKVKRSVDAGTEDRVVECEERYDLNRWCVSLWRLDTNEQVGPERNMTPEEQERLRQMDLFNLEKVPKYDVPEQPPPPMLALPPRSAPPVESEAVFYDADDELEGDVPG